MKIFISYSYKNTRHREALETHLAPLRRQHEFAVWQDGEIPAGPKFDPAIKEHVKGQLTTADIVVLLISAEFFESDYCFCTEMQEAVARHDRGEAAVIPVIIDHGARWQEAPFGKLKGLPHDGRPMIDWRPQSEAWVQVVEAINTRLTSNTRQSASPPPARKPSVDLPWPENPYFQDPHGILDRIAATLKARGATAVTHGTGGVGKTQAALHYAHRNKDTYRLVWWVEAESEAGLDLAFAAIAKALGLPQAEARVMSETRAAVRDWLARETGWLLVLDNAEDLQALARHLPPCPVGHVIITSRSSDWDQVATPLPLDRWPDPDSVDFLLARTGRSDRAGAEALARDLDSLPLALEQAAAYIKASAASFTEYRHLFQEHFAQLVGGAPPGDCPAPLLTTWDISLHAAERACSAAGDLMRLLAVFAPNEIPRSLFLEEGALPAPLATLADPFVFNDAVAALQRYSLIAATEEALSVHRLVQQATKSRSNGDDLWTNAGVRLVGIAFPFYSDEVRTWPQCARLRIHTESLLSNSSNRPADPKLETHLLSQLADYLKYSAEFAAACACLERVLFIYEATYGPDHPRVASGLNNLGTVLRVQGDLDGAHARNERALRIGEAAYGPDHPTVAIYVNNLGGVLCEQGDLDGAHAYIERALRILQKSLGDNHPRTQKIRDNLEALKPLMSSKAPC